MAAENETQPEKKDFPEEFYYSADGYYWVKVEDENLKIGLTRLGAEIYRVKKIWVKPVGTPITKGNSLAGFIGERAGGLDSPVSGTVVEVNDILNSSPNVIFNDPYNEGWIVIIKPSKWEEERKQLQEVTSEEFKKLLETKLKAELEKTKEPYVGDEFTETPPQYDPFTTG